MYLTNVMQNFEKFKFIESKLESYKLDITCMKSNSWIFKILYFFVYRLLSAFAHRKYQFYML